MLEILLNGVSTRRYRRVIPEMADTVGVSRSAVSRETIEASEAALKQLLERQFDKVELLIIYIDGMHFDGLQPFCQFVATRHSKLRSGITRR